MSSDLPGGGQHAYHRCCHAAENRHALTFVVVMRVPNSSCDLVRMLTRADKLHRSTYFAQTTFRLPYWSIVNISFHYLVLVSGERYKTKVKPCAYVHRINIPESDIELVYMALVTGHL